MKCPRCSGELRDGMEVSLGGAYRGGQETESGCMSCGVAVYERSELAERIGTTPVDLTRSPLCRVRAPIDAPCGACGGDLRERLDLSWNGIRDVIVEVCGGCRSIAIARADGRRLQQMLLAAEPMHRIG